jgi:hypothetical protein
MSIPPSQSSCNLPLSIHLYPAVYRSRKYIRSANGHENTPAATYCHAGSGRKARGELLGFWAQHAITGLPCCSREARLCLATVHTLIANTRPRTHQPLPRSRVWAVLFLVSSLAACDHQHLRGGCGYGNTHRHLIGDGQK